MKESRLGNFLEVEIRFITSKEPRFLALGLLRKEFFNEAELLIDGFNQ